MKRKIPSMIRYDEGQRRHPTYPLLPLLASRACLQLPHHGSMLALFFGLRATRTDFSNINTIFGHDRKAGQSWSGGSSLCRGLFNDLVGLASSSRRKLACTRLLGAERSLFNHARQRLIKGQLIAGKAGDFKGRRSVVEIRSRAFRAGHASPKAKLGGDLSLFFLQSEGAWNISMDCLSQVLGMHWRIELKKSTGCDLRNGEGSARVRVLGERRLIGLHFEGLSEVRSRYVKIDSVQRSKMSSYQEIHKYQVALFEGW